MHQASIQYNSLIYLIFSTNPYMSWRILFATLLLGIAASVWGGFQLGNWLIEHGPLKSDVFDAYKDLYTVPTLDADGKPYVPSPPQPLVSGRLAVPEDIEALNWEIDQDTNLLAERPPIALATANQGFTTGNINRRAVSPSGLQGIAQINNSGSQRGLSNNPNTNVLQPIDMDAPPPPPSQEVQVNNLPVQKNPNWQADFQRELAMCDSKSFLQTPSCKWDARNKYCGPNNAWGKVPNCPSKAF